MTISANLYHFAPLKLKYLKYTFDQLNKFIETNETEKL